MSREIPIACTLGPGAYSERVAWIAALNRKSLRAHERHGRSLILTYSSDALADVRELVRRESECCGFLRFDVQEMEEGVRLCIESPDVGETDGALDALLSPFLPGITPSACQDNSSCCSSTDREPVPTNIGRGGQVPKVAALSGMAAVACGICCVLPLAVPALTLSALGGAVAVAAGSYWWVLGIRVVAVGAGWLWVVRQSARSGRRPAPATLRGMVLASVVVGVAYAWSVAEPFLIAALRR